jgi:hypothetical protein
VKRPVFSFEAELLTDAPYDLVVSRLCEAGPLAFKCLRPLGAWTEPVQTPGQLVLRWSHTTAGAEASGALVLAPDPKGAHLRLEGCLRGWMGFLLLGRLRWRTDRLLDRLVGEL